MRRKSVLPIRFALLGVENEDKQVAFDIAGSRGLPRESGHLDLPWHLKACIHFVHGLKFIS